MRDASRRLIEQVERGEVRHAKGQKRAQAARSQADREKGPEERLEETLRVDWLVAELQQASHLILWADEQCTVGASVPRR